MSVQPVYIRGDFVNVHVELDSEQIEELVTFAKQLDNDRVQKQTECAQRPEGHSFDKDDHGTCFDCGLTIKEL